MKRLTLFLSFLLLCIIVSAQTTVVTGPKKKPQTTAPTKPTTSAAKPKQTQKTKPKPQQPKVVKPQVTMPMANNVDITESNIYDKKESAPMANNVYLLEDKVYDVVEQQPIFNGNINQWLDTNLNYPPSAAKDGIEGRVIVQFVVVKDGSILNAHIVRSVETSLDKEALRVVNSMPKWVPGKQNGKVVNCKCTIPIIFRLP